MKPDFTVGGGGTVYTVQPQNEGALDFLKSLGFEGWQWLGNSLAVEHRFIENFVRQLEADGWSVA